MPISITYLLTAVDTPTPQAAPTPAIGDGSTGPFATGMVTGVANRLNQIAAIATLLGQAGSGGYAVLSGLDLSAGTGLNVALSPGIALLDGPLELVGSGPIGFAQVPAPAPYTLADNATSCVWLTDTGSLVAATSTTPPTGGKLYLGTVTTASGAVAAIDYSGRVSLVGGQFVRQTADLSTPGDAPGFKLLTKTATGQFLFDGVSHKMLVDLTKQLPASTNVQALTATLSLSATSANNQYLTASGANRDVDLPDPSTIPLGWNIAIFNAGPSNDIVVKDHTGTTTLATLTPGQAVSGGTILSSGAVAFPATWTPGTPSGEVPTGPI